MKKHLTLLAAACLLMTNAFAQQSKAQSEWVPTHEFQLELFGGFSNLNYKIDPNFVNVNYNWADALAGGLGFGYTWHANDWFGISTGVEFALYRGGFTANDYAVGFTKMWTDPEHDKKLFSAISYSDTKNVLADDGSSYTAWNNVSFSEKQTVYTAQIPIMAQFMVPLNARKSHHFYAAVGAKIGFNIYGSYNRSGVTGSDGSIAPRHSSGSGDYDNLGYIKDDDVANLDGDLRNEDANWSGFRDAAGNILTISQLSRAQNAALFSRKDYFDEDKWKNKPTFENHGKMNLNLIQVLASVELGFRWGLGNGHGLYTGLYLDYGFMPMCKNTNSIYDYAGVKNNEGGVMNYSNTPIIYNGSMLECTYDDPGISVDPADAAKWSWDPKNARTDLAIASRLSNIGAGIKLRYAFGYAKPKPAPEPVIQYVERIVRDTVTVVNTVIQKDTVTNTVVVRDTVTVIKEVPVEIKKVMTDLSNSLFDSGKAIIKDQAKGPLYTVVMWLKENPNAKVEVSGHTDNVGGAAYNQKLSEARAKAVYDYFIANGVNADRLSYAGYGMDRPIAPNDTPQGRQQNRRVELNLVE